MNTSQQDTAPDQKFFQTSNVVFSDQMMQIGVGPHVCRLVFGLENGPGSASPNLTLVLPTATLVNLANNLTSVLADDNNVKLLQSQLEAFASSLPSALVTATGKKI